jgi:hypothetical protein
MGLPSQPKTSDLNQKPSPIYNHLFLLLKPHIGIWGHFIP